MMAHCPSCSRRDFVRLALGSSAAAGMASKFALPFALGQGKTDLPGCIVLGGEPPAGAAYLSPDRGPTIIDRLENPSADLVQSTEYFAKGTLERRWRLLRGFEEDWNKKHGDARIEARE